MARDIYGGQPADFFVNSVGAPVPDQIADVYRTRTGGVPETDLMDMSNVARTTAKADAFGGLRFQGPDNYKGELWVQSPGGTLRYLLNPISLTARLITVEASIVSLTASLSGVPALIATAVANGVADAAEGTDAVMTAHILAADPHSQYPLMLGTAVGANIWGTASAFDPAEANGDYTFVGA